MEHTSDHVIPLLKYCNNFSSKFSTKTKFLEVIYKVLEEHSPHSLLSPALFFPWFTLLQPIASLLFLAHICSLLPQDLKLSPVPGMLLLQIPMAHTLTSFRSYMSPSLNTEVFLDILNTLHTSYTSFPALL